LFVLVHVSGMPASTAPVDAADKDVIIASFMGLKPEPAHAKGIANENSLLPALETEQLSSIQGQIFSMLFKKIKVSPASVSGLVVPNFCLFCRFI